MNHHKRKPGTSVLSRVGVTVWFAGLLLGGGRARAQSLLAPEPENVVGVELFGRGFIYSVNYERLFEKGGAGFGIALWPAGSSRAIAIVPVYVSWTPVGRTHQLYLSVGATLVTGTLEGSGPVDSVTSGAGHLFVGYQLRSARDSLVRPMVGLFVGGTRGYSIGVTFARRF